MGSIYNQFFILFFDVSEHHLVFTTKYPLGKIAMREIRIYSF